MKLKLKEKLFYGLGDLGNNVMFSAMSFYLLYFMVKIGNVEPTLAGLVIFLSKLWDAVTDYLMGRISDKTVCKFGKRRIYMLFGTLPSILCFVLLFVLPPSASPQWAKFLYFLFVNCLYNTAWTVVYVPYNSLTANMTEDYDDRTSLNSTRIIMANVGILLGAAFFSLLAEGKESLLYPVFGLKNSYIVAAAILGCAAMAAMFACTFGVKERILTGSENTYNFWDTLKQFFRLKEFRNTTAYYLLSMIGFDVVMAVYMFFVTDSLSFGGGAVSMLFVAIPLVSAMAVAPFWDWFASKFGKIRAYVLGALITTFILAFCGILPTYPESPVGAYVGLILVSAFAGVGISAVQIMPWASLPDVIEVDEYENRVRREGAYYGLMSFLYKFASGSAVFVVGLFLGIFGYSETAEAGTQPESARLAIRIVLSVLPGIIFLVSLWFARHTGINKERFDMIQTELKRRKESKE